MPDISKVSNSGFSHKEITTPRTSLDFRGMSTSLAFSILILEEYVRKSRGEESSDTL